MKKRLTFQQIGRKAYAHESTTTATSNGVLGATKSISPYQLRDPIPLVTSLQPSRDLKMLVRKKSSCEPTFQFQTNPIQAQPFLRTLKQLRAAN